MRVEGYAIKGVRPKMKKKRKPPRNITKRAEFPITIYEAELHLTAVSSTWHFQKLIRTKYASTVDGWSVRYGNHYRKLRDESEMEELIHRATKGEFFMFVNGKSVRSPKERKLIKSLPWVNVDEPGRPCPE
jgi:hypothetical protein